MLSVLNDTAFLIFFRFYHTLHAMEGHRVKESMALKTHMFFFCATCATVFEELAVVRKKKGFLL